MEASGQPVILGRFLLSGSLSPVRGGHFDECVDEHANAICSALDDVASSSQQNNQQPGSGWTSSDDEVEAIELEDEGFFGLPLHHSSNIGPPTVKQLTL